MPPKSIDSSSNDKKKSKVESVVEKKLPSSPVNTGDRDKRKSFDQFHTAIMILLYLSQGMVQGSNNSCSTLLQQYRNVTLSEQSLLTLPIYAFSFKFLWAPLVDSLYISKRARRPTWIIACQILTCLFSLFISVFWMDVLRDDITSLVLVMAAMSFNVATQDIAVDAWAVEGVAEERSSWAGTAQTVGLLTGWCATRSFFILQEWELVSKEHGAQGLFSVLLGVQCFVLVVVSWYRVGSTTCSYALNEAERAEIKHSDLKKNNNTRKDTPQKMRKLKAEKEKSKFATTYEAFREVLSDMRQIVSRSWFYDVCIVILLRGICWAGSGLIGVQLLKRYGVSPAFSSSLNLGLLPLQLFASSVAPSFMKYLREKYGWSSLQSWYRIIMIQIAFDFVSWGHFTFFATDSYEYRMYVVVPSTIIETILHTFVFNAVATFFSELSRQVPHSTGTAITLLNSMANFGMMWPQSFGLFVGGKITEKWFPANGEHEITPLQVTHGVMWAFFALGTLVQMFVVRPAVDHLTLTVKAHNEEMEMKRGDDNKLD